MYVAESPSPRETALTKSLSLFRQAIDIDPAHTPSEAGLIWTQYLLGQIGDVDEACRRLRQVAHCDPSAECELGRIYYYSGSMDKALTVYRAVAQANPSNSQALTGAGTTFIRMGLFTQAVEILEKALEIEPESQAARENLRVAQERLAGETDGN